MFFPNRGFSFLVWLARADKTASFGSGFNLFFEYTCMDLDWARVGQAGHPFLSLTEWVIGLGGLSFDDSVLAQDICNGWRLTAGF